MTEIENGLKDLFSSNTLNNIRLGIELALSQGLSWEYIAEKCLFGGWLTFDEHHCFYPIEYKNHTGSIMIHKSDIKEIYIQFDRNHALYPHGYREFITSIERNYNTPIIKRMVIFLKLIQDNEYNLM